MAWELIQTSKQEWKQDNSGLYTIINGASTHGKCIRVDVMTLEHDPVVSFQGDATDVRKALMKWLDKRISQKAGLGISIEHAAYIGAEIARAELLKENFVQG